MMHIGNADAIGSACKDNAVGFSRSRGESNGINTVSA